MDLIWIYVDSGRFMWIYMDLELEKQNVDSTTVDFLGVAQEIHWGGFQRFSGP